MVDDLQARFGIPGSVSVATGRGGLLAVTLTHASGAAAEAYLHGGHVASWRTPAGKELLFVSRESLFEPGRPIRGGIPVVFPQFGPGRLPQHGFARTSPWSLIRTEALPDGDVLAVLQLVDTPETRAVWPYAFRLSLEVRLGAETLRVGVRLANAGDDAFDFQFALHTYFGVGDIRRTAVEGLQGVTYVDSLREDARETESRPAVRFAGEVDRVYVQAPDALRVVDEARVISIRKDAMPDVVVWNPWIAKAQRMADFGDDEYLQMVCVETGVVDGVQTLLPGEEWAGETILRLLGGR